MAGIGGRSTLAAIVVLAMPGLAAADPDPADVEPIPKKLQKLGTDVAVVLNAGTWKSGFTRLLVDVVCSPEHCWSEGYLQWVESVEKPSGATRQRVHSTIRMSEVAYGVHVEGGRTRIIDGRLVLDVFVTESHGLAPSRTLRVRTDEPGQYQATLLPPWKRKSVPKDALYIEGTPLGADWLWIACREAEQAGTYKCQRYTIEGTPEGWQRHQVCTPNSEDPLRVTKCPVTDLLPQKLALRKAIPGLIFIEPDLALKPVPPPTWDR